MTHIIILGYGKMGQAIESACLSRALDKYQIIKSLDELQTCEFEKNSVVIEFTRAPQCMENYKFLMQKNVPVVTGTTGWDDHEDEIKSLVQQHKGRFLYAANFSIGVHLFWATLEKAAQLFNAQDKYDVYGHEVHHPMKADSPSGTAVKTAQILLDNITRKKKQVSGDVSGPVPKEDLHFSASRGGYQFGEHSVMFDGPDDMITLTHHAKNRDGFANGAIDCALWLERKNHDGYYTINNYLKEVLT